MEIKINAIEVATTLAHAGMYDEVTNPLYDGSIVTQEDDLYEFKDDEQQGYKEEFQLIFNRHYDYFFEILTNAMDTTYFPVTHTCKEDLEGIGFDTTNVEHSTMERLASKLGDDYCEQLYWIALPIIAEHLGIPKKQEEEDAISTIHFGTTDSFVVDAQTYAYFNKVKNNKKLYNELYIKLKTERDGK